MHVTVWMSVYMLCVFCVFYVCPSVQCNFGCTISAVPSAQQSTQKQNTKAISENSESQSKCYNLNHVFLCRVYVRFVCPVRLRSHIMAVPLLLLCYQKHNIPNWTCLLLIQGTRRSHWTTVPSAQKRDTRFWMPLPFRSSFALWAHPSCFRLIIGGKITFQ